MYLYYSMTYQGEVLDDYTEPLILANKGHSGTGEQKKRGSKLYVKRSYDSGKVGQSELDKFKAKITVEGSGMEELTEEQYNLM